MEGSFSRYLSSPIFTFQVGLGKEDILVHSGPIADLSPALFSLLNGGMVESSERRVLWPDVTKETFTRFCEFAYSQDYTPPPFQQKDHFEVCITTEVELKSEQPKNHEFWDGWDTWSSAIRRKKEKVAARRGIPQRIDAIPPNNDTVPEEPDPYAKDYDIDHPSAIVDTSRSRDRTISEVNLRAAFSNLSYPSVRNTQRFDPISNWEQTQDFTPVFMGHAELYILADKYGIESLRQLVLYKLYDTFRNFTIHDTDVAGILEFIRFAYDNTAKQLEEMDPLRKLSTYYIASILDQIGNRDDFKQLLSEGGEFVVDFWSTVWNVDKSTSP